MLERRIILAIFQVKEGSVPCSLSMRHTNLSVPAAGSACGAPPRFGCLALASTSALANTSKEANANFRMYACLAGMATMRDVSAAETTTAGESIGRTITMTMKWLRTAKVACVIAGYLTTLLPSAQAFGREINVLLIHGRLHNTKEHYGHFRSDQAGAWGGLTPTTGGTRWYVQWDAWNHHFDDSSWPGGEAVIHAAIDALCDNNKGQACWILCHSAGCAAFEDYLAKSDYAHNSILIEHVMAADSAAGGSELADNGLLRWIGGLTGASGNIDNSLKTSYARGAYNHNHMQSVVIRGVGGATSSYPFADLIACHFFPRQTGSGLNSQCTGCLEFPFKTARECDDGTVALHSTCGHNRKASFQDCNSRIPPHNDVAGTYDFHGWWISDHVCNGDFRQNCSWSGPYSDFGHSVWDSRFKTYRVDHTDGKKVIVNEYSWAPAALCP